MPQNLLSLSPAILARIEAAAAEQGLSSSEWVERLVQRETESGRSTIAALESRRIGPEDEARGGPQAPGTIANPTDD
ncbi:hypothetical protein [Roseococcus sp.]|uniref:hypothetical protein n=1 Tax=Roseococcus sp. TaxID=2109646 RepID=UPI003BAB24AF